MHPRSRAPEHWLLGFLFAKIETMSYINGTGFAYKPWSSDVTLTPQQILYSVDPRRITDQPRAQYG